MCSDDDTWSVVPVQIPVPVRPHSVYADHNNYVKFSFRGDDINTTQHNAKINNKQSHRKERSENHYETVLDGSHMNTMDIRIKITDDIIKESDRFSDDSSSSSQEYKTIAAIPNDKLFRSDIVNKAKNFKKKCLARISSLTVR